MKQFKQAMARLFGGMPHRPSAPRRSVVSNKLRAEAERLGCEIEPVEGGGFHVWPPADMQPADDPFASFHYADDTTTARWMLQEYARVLGR